MARSFRGDVGPGTRAQTTFACAPATSLNEDGVYEPVVGGTITHDARAVARAGAVELHTAPEGGLAGYGHGLLLLDAPAFPFRHLPPEGESCP